MLIRGRERTYIRFQVMPFGRRDILPYAEFLLTPRERNLHISNKYFIIKYANMV